MRSRRSRRTARSSRRLISGWLVATLLFMQFAVAAHACKVPGRAFAGSQAGAATVHGPDCHGGVGPTVAAATAATRPDADPPSLCKAHCQQGAQTPGVAPSADVPATPGLPIATLDWAQAALAVDAVATSAGQPPALRSGAPPPGAPPLFLSLLVLRR